LELEDLYALIPQLQCNPGCTRCCVEFGVPSMVPAEAERLDRFLQMHGIEKRYAKGTTCPYVDEQGCIVYPVRPLICRLYGNSPNYLCTVGARPIYLLSEDEEAEIFHFYYTYFAAK